MKTLIVVVLTLLAGASASAQGVVMVLNETTGGGQVTQSRMQLDATHVRADVRDQRGQQAVVLYDATAQLVRIVNPGARTYTELTQKEMQSIGGAMTSMLAQMEKQLANMPPEQRKMLEDMMKARGGGAGMPGAAAGPARLTYTRTGTSKVGQWACTTYDGFRGPEKVQEVCAAESGLDANLADFRAVQQLAEFFRSLSPQQADQIAVFGTVESQGFAGFPVRRVMLRDGKAIATSELSELRRETIPASAWAVPEGYTREAVTMPR